MIDKRYICMYIHVDINQAHTHVTSPEEVVNCYMNSISPSHKKTIVYVYVYVVDR